MAIPGHAPAYVADPGGEHGTNEVPAAKLRALAGDLGRWFALEQRDLSWRRTRDPYAVWVSEVMLQQTRVETVERYYSRFMERFPDVGALAAADEDSVLQAWSGLGYYRRARLLHAGARHVAQDLDGRLPRRTQQLQQIPGIGRYTAGAISNIAFDTAAPLVDGNVARVLSRIRGIAEPKRQGAAARGHWSVAGALVEHGSPRVIAQALMELGATICTAKSPRCGRCPVRHHCEAAHDGTVASIPAPRPKAAVRVERYVALGVVVRTHLLLRRRPATGLLAGLWCVPLLRVSANGQLEAPEFAIPELDLRSVCAREAPLRHVFTHRIWELRPLRMTIPNRKLLGRLSRADTAWIEVGQTPPGGIPSVTQKLLAHWGFAAETEPQHQASE